ncbi:unnamed protein product, partial [Amoebophrya sp. A25]
AISCIFLIGFVYRGVGPARFAADVRRDLMWFFPSSQERSAGAPIQRQAGNKLSQWQRACIFLCRLNAYTVPWFQFFIQAVVLPLSAARDLLLVIATLAGAGSHSSHTPGISAKNIKIKLKDTTFSSSHSRMAVQLLDLDQINLRGHRNSDRFSASPLPPSPSAVAILAGSLATLFLFTLLHNLCVAVLLHRWRTHTVFEPRNRFVAFIFSVLACVPRQFGPLFWR